MTSTSSASSTADAASPPLDARSLHLRRLVLRALLGAGRGHMPSAFSLIEIFRVLYDDVMTYRADAPKWPDRDRCILSKGHGALALYAILADKGFFALDDLDTTCNIGSPLGGHPEAHKVPGVEASTGALGHGLAIGVGQALSARIRKSTSRVFVIMGDGEIDEGAVWEAAMAAGKHRLSNLTAIVDYNKLQSYGPTREVLDLEPLADKWRAFNFTVADTDGHDPASIRQALARLDADDSGKPRALICHTVKGKGVPLAENDPTWHHKNKLTDEELNAIRSALGE